MARETYGIVEEYGEAIVDKNWMGEDSKLIFLGGIMINTEGAYDLFYPIRFESHDKSGVKLDLMGVFDQIHA